MARQSLMRRFAQWHIWLGWLVGVPIVAWLASGLFMTLKPLPEVRGDHLRITPETPQALIIQDSALASPDAQLKEMRLVMQDGRAVAILTGLDGVTSRVDVATSQKIPPLTAAQARALVARKIHGADTVQSVTLFEADETPFDFRRPVAVWRVVLEDGAYIYVGRDTGQIEAVRTRWWRWFDIAWGVHIMDLSERSDTSHPILIGFAALSLSGAVLGCVLMFRRRKAKVKVKVEAGKSG